MDVLDVQKLVNIIILHDPPVRPTQGDINLDQATDVLDLQLQINEILGLNTQFVHAVPGVIQRIPAQAPWSFQLQAYGGKRPFAWSVTRLPSWMSADSAGNLWGVPPAPDLVDLDFSVTDADNNVILGHALLTVLTPALPPVLRQDHFDVPLAGTLAVGAPGVLGNDQRITTSTTISAYTQPSIGTVVLSPDGAFTYQRIAPLQGNRVTFTYTVTTPSSSSFTATVYLWTGNRSPQVSDDEFNATAGIPLNRGFTLPPPLGQPLGVLGNDGDFENDPFTATVVSMPATGVLLFNPDGTFRYTPPHNHPGGVEVFTYAAVDSGSQIPSIGTVRINVASVTNSSVEVYQVPKDLPFRRGFPATIQVTVLDSANNQAIPYNNIATVSLDASSLGASGAIPMVAGTFAAANEIRYSATFTIPATAAFGVNNLTVTVANLAQNASQRTFRVLVYEGTPLTVGGSGGFPSVQAAVDAAPPNGAVFLGNFNGFTWAAPTGLIATKPVIVCLHPSIEDYIQFATQPFGFHPIPPGDIILAPGGSHHGLILARIPFGSAATVPGPAASPLLHVQHSVHLLSLAFFGFALSGSGGLIEASGAGTGLAVLDCMTLRCSSVSATPAPVKGAMIYAHSGASAVVRDCHFNDHELPINSLGPVWGGLIAIEGSPAQSLVIEHLRYSEPYWTSANRRVRAAGGVRGGAFYVDGTAFALRGWNWEFYVGDSSTPHVHGGIVCLVGGANAEMALCSFQAFPQSVAGIVGAGVLLGGGSALVVDRCSISQLNFQSGSAIGGGIAMGSDCLLVLEHSNVGGFAVGEGGGIWCGTLPAGTPIGNNPVARIGPGRIDAFNATIVGTQMSWNPLPSSSLYVGPHMAAGPGPVVTLRSCTVFGQLAVHAGSLTLLDSYVPNGGFLAPSVLPSATISHTFAYFGALTGHVHGQNGNFGSISDSNPWFTSAESQLHRMLCIDRGSTTALALGFDSLPNSSVGISDTGVADVGARDFFSPTVIGPLISTTVSQLRLAHP